MLRHVLLVLALFTSGAVMANPMVVPERPQGPTGADKSKYFISEAALVLVEKGAPAAKFGITPGMRKRLPKGSVVVAENVAGLRVDA